MSASALQTSEQAPGLGTGFAAQPRWLLFAEMFGLTAGVGVADYFTGAELSVLALYGGPIILTAWLLGRTPALTIAVVSAAAWWLANQSSHPYRTVSGHWWAMASRMATFGFVAVGAAALKNQREVDRDRIAALEHARRLEQEIVRASEDEQQRIGRDLHDGLCHHLALITFSARALAEDLAHDSASRAEEARRIESLLKDSLSDARNLSRGLMPVPMEGIGLGVSLDELALMTSRCTGIAVTFRELGDPCISDVGAATQLYRIAQEALTNALKHSRATEIMLTLAREETAVVLRIADNGIGFACEGSARGGIGLRTMNYRARMIGARLSLSSGTPGGVCVSCHFPLTPCPHSAATAAPALTA